MNDADFRFRILVTADLHGQFLAVDYASGKPSNHGFARISASLKAMKDERTLLIDLGDLLQGSPLMSFHEQNRTKYQNPAAMALNYLDYDLFVPGNHDFNYGQDYLDDFLSQLKAKSLCANICRNNQPAFGAPYEIKSFPGGPTIAIIGITTHYIPIWERKANIEGLSFQDAFEATKKYVKLVRSRHNPDLVVVAYHGGFECDLDTFEPYIEDTGENQGSKMLKEIEGIDVLLTSHQHRTIAKKVGETLVLQPTYNGKGFGKVDCHFRKTDGVWKKTESEISVITDVVGESDPALGEILESIELATQEYLDIPIGIVQDDDLLITDLFQARLRKHKIVTLINKVQIESTGAMISATSLGNSATGFSKEITIRNVLSTYVYPNTLVVIEIDGKHLKMALEQNAQYFDLEDGKIIFNSRFSYPKNEHYNYDMFDGIEYIIDVAKPYGERIVSLSYQGRPVKDHHVFTLALNNYRASGGGEFPMYRGQRVVKEINDDIAELVIEYIRKNKIIRVDDPNNIRVIIGAN
ncbi:MAG: bifunctional metallophosphatase/5'-nucleotidase [Candidatus Izemoplasmatales bacterium]|jgi:2',3'-cyclic-nucleotide 2'-phosphodiesterase/3'-nucleotidase